MGGLGISGQAEVTVRTAEGQIKGRCVFNNTIRLAVLESLMGAVCNSEPYPPPLVPERIYCKLDNQLQTNLGVIGNNSSTVVIDDNTIAAQFSVYGLTVDWSDSSSSFAALVSHIYLLGSPLGGSYTSIAVASRAAGEIDPVAHVTENDTIDVVYSIFIRAQQDVNLEFLNRLSYLIRGVKRLVRGQGEEVDYNVMISRARLFNDLGEESAKGVLYLPYGNPSTTETRTQITFFDVDTAPFQIRLYLWDAELDLLTEVFRDSVNVEGWHSGDTVLVPFSITFRRPTTPSPTSPGQADEFLGVETQQPDLI